MTSLIFSFFVLFGILSSFADSSILNDEHGLPKRTEGEMTALFRAWTIKQGKAYNSLGERKKRFEIFKDNLSFIDKRNAMNLTYKLGLTRFADLTNEEYRLMYLSQVNENRWSLNGSRDSNRYAFRAGENLPKSVDWREKGAVLPYVKSQGQCESCWAFSALATVEAINQIVTGKLISLSEQELTDCSRNKGCKKGNIDLAFLYIIANGGIDTEEHYPFKGVTAQCNPKRAKVVSIDRYERVTPSKDEKSLQKAVANQPISVAINGSDTNFQLYKSGVFTGPCNTETDHFVAAVGYASEKGLDYWIVRNSWGPNWGEKGYIRMQRNLVGNRNGMCGIAKWANYPIKKGKRFPNPEKKVWSS